LKKKEINNKINNEKEVKKAIEKEENRSLIQIIFIFIKNIFRSTKQ